MSETFIKVENLSFSYEADTDSKSIPAVDGVSLEINKGEYVAILGQNGSGKSTFAKLLNFILEPTSGKIVVDGMDITSEELTDDDVMTLRKNVGMVFQNPDNQLVATIVEDDVAFGLENLGVPSAEIRRRVDKALSDLGMLEYAKHGPHRLSGGQKQRVAIAGVMAMEPKCIIFDESTAMLDPLGRRDVMNSIVKLNREKNITVVMITHYMDEAAMADRIVVLNDGGKLLDGTPDCVFEQESLLVECGLAIPQCTEIVHRLRDCGISLDGKCVSFDDCVELIVQSLSKEKNKE